jgi:hypothetical protein
MKLYLRQLLRRYMCAAGLHQWGPWLYKERPGTWVPLFSKTAYTVTITEGRRTCERCGKLQEVKV